MGSPSLDQLRLLYIVNRFTHSGANGKRRWVKELPLSILVYHGIDAGIFTDYDWAPSLVEFHGVKMYGKVSQEAHADLKQLQGDKLVEKLHLSTCLYDSIRAFRATGRAADALRSLPEECRVSLDGLVLCPQCEAVQEVLAYVERVDGRWGEVRNATVRYCARCCTVTTRPGGARIETSVPGARTPIDFFDIADVVYRARPTTSGGLS